MRVHRRGNERRCREWRAWHASDGRRHEPLLEAHVFDFAGDLYGREIEVEFVDKLREEERFVDLAALTRQMHLMPRRRGCILEC